MGRTIEAAPTGFRIEDSMPPNPPSELVADEELELLEEVLLTVVLLSEVALVLVTSVVEAVVVVSSPNARIPTSVSFAVSDTGGARCLMIL